MNAKVNLIKEGWYNLDIDNNKTCSSMLFVHLLNARSLMGYRTSGCSLHRMRREVSREVQRFAQRGLLTEWVVKSYFIWEWSISCLNDFLRVFTCFLKKVSKSLVNYSSEKLENRSWHVEFQFEQILIISVLKFTFVFVISWSWLVNLEVEPIFD